MEINPIEAKQNAQNEIDRINDIIEELENKIEEMKDEKVKFQNVISWADTVLLFQGMIK
jgi:peptidoglycan hydrolase CwlO-like protein